MTRKSIALLAASHFLVITAGFLLANLDSESVSKANTSTQSSAKNPGSNTSLGPKSPTGKSAAFRPSKEWRGSEFSRAWKAVRTAGLNTGDRVKTQRELLKRWADVDLSAAIEAALGEEWDGDGNDYFDNAGPFLDVFADALAKNPQESWDMIRARQFGLGTSMLRSVWIKAVGRKDPVFLAAKIGEVSWRDRNRVIWSCQEGVTSMTDNSARQKVFETLKAFPEEIVSLDALKNFMPEGGDSDPAGIKSEILRIQDQDQKMAKLQAMKLGRLLVSESVEEIDAKIQDLPENLQAEVAWAALPPLSEESERILQLLDRVMDGGAWNRIESKETIFRVDQLVQQGNEAEVAQWATTMPFRKETTGLFYRSVGSYLRKNQEAARGWIAGIENSEWRDRAYMEYSQQALNSHKDMTASSWALSQISDSSLKTTAEGWRAQWEAKRTGK